MTIFLRIGANINLKYNITEFNINNSNKNLIEMEENGIMVQFDWTEHCSFGLDEGSEREWLLMPVYLALIQGGEGAIKSYIESNFIHDPIVKSISNCRMRIS